MVVYLPELYDQVLSLAEYEQLSVRSASERVLGTTFARLGVAVAQTWRLPPHLLSATRASRAGCGGGRALASNVAVCQATSCWWQPRRAMRCWFAFRLSRRYRRAHHRAALSAEARAWRE